MEPILEIKGLSKAFGGLQAVLNFDLTVNQGDLMGLIGPNGAGKTTIFNLITGFIRADSGEVRFKGRRITHLKPYQIVNHGVARTFQLVDLFKEMTVLENVMVPCFSHRGKAKRHDGKKAWEMALEFLEEVGLAHRFNESVGNLAFGELRLLDIARAMATDPEILLLDEPFSGLDVEDAAVLSKAIQGMHQRGQTMIIIEHRLKDLLKLVKGVVAIVFGLKIAEGTPEEIMSNEKVITAYLGERRE
jgi:ABC-type branched-subunit amino acid transport system ATPase component